MVICNDSDIYISIIYESSKIEAILQLRLRKRGHVNNYLPAKAMKPQVPKIIFYNPAGLAHGDPHGSTVVLVFLNVGNTSKEVQSATASLHSLPEISSIAVLLS